MITDEMKSLLATYIAGTLIDTTDGGDVGMGGNSTNPSATTLDVPLGVAAPITATSNENLIQIKITVAKTSVTGKTLREAGIFDASDNLLLREAFEGIGPFNSSGDIEIVFVLEVE